MPLRSDMTFISKKDLWVRPIFIVSLALLAGSAYRSAMENGVSFMTFIDAAFFIFLAWIYWGTYYRIETNSLVVKCGPFKWTIDIKTIKSIAPTKNPLSSPALSLDRLEITYGEKKRMMLSPLDKNGFANALIQIHPEIQIKGTQK